MLGPLPSLRSYGILGLVSSALGFGHSGSSTSPRFFTYLGLAMSYPGMCQCASLMSTLDIAHSKMPLLLRGLACLGASLPTLNPLHLEVMPSLRSRGHLDTASPLWGVSRPGMTTAVLDLAQLDATILSQFLVQPDSLLLVLDSLHLDSTLSLQSSTCIDAASLVFSMACVKPSSLLSDFIHPSLLLSFRRPAHSELAFSIFSMG